MIDTAQVRIDDLIEYHDNPRVHSLDAIMESLATLRQYKKVTVNRGTLTGRRNEILAGNGTVKAARQLGWTVIEADFIDVDETTARKINLIDNRASDLSTYDTDKLVESLGLLDDLVATGYSMDDVARMITPPDFQPEDETGRLDDVQPKHCPQCGFEWREGPKGEIRPV